MDIGMIGLGRMGGNMVQRLREGGHRVVGYDMAADSGRDVDSLSGLVEALPGPRTLWVMVPAGAATDGIIAELSELLDPGDLVECPDRVCDSWREGSVVRSWLLDLLVRALKDDPDLARIAGRAEETGEARWMVQDGLDMGVPLPVTAASLFARQNSQLDDPMTMKVVAALRNQFGGHAMHSERA